MGMFMGQQTTMALKLVTSRCHFLKNPPFSSNFPHTHVKKATKEDDIIEQEWVRAISCGWLSWLSLLTPTTLLSVLHSIMSPELKQNLLSKQPSLLAWNQLFIPNLEANRKKKKKKLDNTSSNVDKNLVGPLLVNDWFNRVL